MSFLNRPLFIVCTLALTIIIAQGTVREVDALIHKPKVLQPGPSSAATSTWTANNNKSMSLKGLHRNPTNYPPQSSQQYPARQRERSKKSLEMNTAHGDMGSQKFRHRILSSTPYRRFLLASMLASMLTITALWKEKAALTLLQYPVWFLSNVLYNPYQNSLVNNPLVTKVITGAVLAMAGDAVAQATSNESALTNNQTKAGYDKRRALSFAVFDSCYRLFQHNVFPVVIQLGQGNFVNKLLPLILPSNNLVAFFRPAAAAIEQTALYQFVIVPCLYYPIFFAFTGFIQGLSARQSIQRMKRQYFPCWKRNLMFWIPTQMVLFGLIAEKWQIPFACLMGMIWSVILSKTAGSTKQR